MIDNLQSFSFYTARGPIGPPGGKLDLCIDI